MKFTQYIIFYGHDMRRHGSCSSGRVGLFYDHGNLNGHRLHHRNRFSQDDEKENQNHRRRSIGCSNGERWWGIWWLASAWWKWAGAHLFWGEEADYCTSKKLMKWGGHNTRILIFHQQFKMTIKNVTKAVMKSENKVKPKKEGLKEKHICVVNTMLMSSQILGNNTSTVKKNQRSVNNIREITFNMRLLGIRCCAVETSSEQFIMNQLSACISR